MVVMKPTHLTPGPSPEGEGREKKSLLLQEKGFRDEVSKLNASNT